MDDMVGKLDWRDLAACRNLPVEIFFPTPGRHMTINVRVAKAYCADCPVRTDCLDYAMSFDDRALPGIWGGTTESERARIRKTVPHNTRVINRR